MYVFSEVELSGSDHLHWEFHFALLTSVRVNGLVSVNGSVSVNGLLAVVERHF